MGEEVGRRPGKGGRRNSSDEREGRSRVAHLPAGLFPKPGTRNPAEDESEAELAQREEPGEPTPTFHSTDGETRPELGPEPSPHSQPAFPAPTPTAQGAGCPHHLCPPLQLGPGGLYPGREQSRAPGTECSNPWSRKMEPSPQGLAYQRSKLRFHLAPGSPENLATGRPPCARPPLTWHSSWPAARLGPRGVSQP